MTEEECESEKREVEKGGRRARMEEVGCRVAEQLEKTRKETSVNEKSTQTCHPINSLSSRPSLLVCFCNVFFVFLFFCSSKLLSKICKKNTCRHQFLFHVVCTLLLLLSLLLLHSIAYPLPSLSLRLSSSFLIPSYHSLSPPSQPPSLPQVTSLLLAGVAKSVDLVLK